MVKMLAVCTLLTGIISCTTLSNKQVQAPPIPPKYSEAHTKSDAFALNSTVGMLVVVKQDKAKKKTILSSGTAFPVRYKGEIFVLSAGHVCESAFNNAAFLFNSDNMFAVQLVYVTQSPDICVIQPKERLREAFNGNAYEIIKDDDAVPNLSKDSLLAYGWAHGERLIKTWHSLAGVSKKDRELVLHGRVYEGMSGSPLVDPDSNKVLGIVVSVDEKQDYMFTAMPNDVLEALEAAYQATR